MRLSEHIAQFDILSSKESKDLQANSGEAALGYLSKYPFHVHKGDLRVADHLYNDADLSLVVTGDLIVDGIYHDNSSGGILIVCGSMWAKHVLSESAMCVQGDLWVQGAILQHYNDWCFECGGVVSGRVFLNADKWWSFDTDIAILEACEIPNSYSFQWEGPRVTDVLKLKGEETQDFCEKAQDFLDCIWDTEKTHASPFRYPEPLPAIDSPGRLRRIMHADTSPSELDDWIKEYPIHVAARTELVAAVHAQLVRHADPRVRQAAAAAPWLASEHVRELAHDDQPLVRAAIAARTDLETDLLQVLLIADTDDAVRRAVASHPALSLAQRRVLIEDSSPCVRRRAIAYLPVTEELVSEFAKSADEDLRAWSASHADELKSSSNESQGANLDQRHQQLLDSSIKVRSAAIQGWRSWIRYDFIEENVERFADDELAEVRQVTASICRNPEILAKLANDPVRDVCQAVTQNYAAPAHILTAMAKYLAETPALDKDGISVGLMTPRTEFASAMLENPFFPSEGFSYIAQFMPLAYPIDEHPNMPLKYFLQREENNTYMEMQDYKDLMQAKNLLDQPAALLKLMAHSEREGFRRMAAINANTPTDTLLFMADRFKEDEDVLKSLALNPHLGNGTPTSTKIIDMLLATESESIIWALLRNSHLQKEVLMREGYRAPILAKVVLWARYGVEFSS